MSTDFDLKIKMDDVLNHTTNLFVMSKFVYYVYNATLESAGGGNNNY